MTCKQRLAAFIYCFRKWTNVQNILSLILTCLCVLSGQPVVAIQTPERLRQLFHYQLIYLLLNRLQEYTSSIPFGYRTFRRRADASVWLAPYLAKALTSEFLAVCLRGTRLDFTPTGSVKSHIRERDLKKRSPFLKRLAAFHSAHGIGYFAACFVVLICGASLSLLRFFTSKCSSSASTITSFPQWLVLSTGILFPGFGLEKFPSLLSPLYYAMFPPTTPPRRAIMFRETATGVWRPQRRAREQYWTKSFWMLELPHCALLMWALWANWKLATL
jgi:hypothetical protein